MAHFARLDDNSIVEMVIVISDDVCPDPAPINEGQGQSYINDVIGLPGTWIQTSYNGNFRGRYAGPGDRYDAVNDAFIPPQPYSGWVLNEESYEWEAPIPRPNDGQFYMWDNVSLQWVVPEV